MENKADFVRELGELLRKYSRMDIERLEIDEAAKYVHIRYKNGYSKCLCVDGDSILGILYDFVKASI